MKAWIKIQIKDHIFWCPLDGDERHESIQEKLSLMGTPGSVDDPYQGIMEIIRQEVNQNFGQKRVH